jgi:hypothetical protein
MSSQVRLSVMVLLMGLKPTAKESKKRYGVSRADLAKECANKMTTF